MLYRMGSGHVTEAFQLPPRGADNVDSFHEWAERVGFTQWHSGRDETLEVQAGVRTMVAQPGDWIVYAECGEFRVVECGHFIGQPV